jgi:phage baseplate assembly protein W
VRYVDHPLRVDGRGRLAGTTAGDHLRDLVEQVLFTSYGERVNRPGFGSALLQQVFAPNGDQLAATMQVLVQGALQEWLGDLLDVERVAVEADESSVVVTVAYAVRRTGQRVEARFAREVPRP